MSLKIRKELLDELLAGYEKPEDRTVRTGCSSSSRALSSSARWARS